MLHQNIVAFRNTISDIQSKTVQLQQRVNQGSAQPAAGGGYQDQEMKNSINTIQNDVKILLNKPQVSPWGGLTQNNVCSENYQCFKKIWGNLNLLLQK